MNNTTETTHARRIVVGFDGSETAPEVLEWAARQAVATDAELQVCTTWHWPSAAGMWGAVLPDGYDPQAEARRELDEAIDELRTRHPSLRVRGEVDQGDAGTTLVAASEGAELLVVGSRGHHELVGMVLASVSEYCVTRAHCPVVVVRGETVPRLPTAGASRVA